MANSVSYAAFLLGLCVEARAQTIEITPTTVQRGSANVFRIILKTHPEKPIVALQWNLVYPEGLRIELSGIVSGSASEAAGKSTACVLKPSKGTNHLLSCIVAGGVKPFPAGAIALVRFEAAKNAPKGEMTVILEKIVGVSPSLESVPIPVTKAAIAIR